MSHPRGGVRPVSSDVGGHRDKNTNLQKEIERHLL